jgi:predicted nucleic acid-binding protein
MLLVDTSAWIEWLTGSPTGATLATELPERPRWLVPAIVQLELAKWLSREVGEAKADQVIAFTETCVVVELDTAIALAAADLCASHKLATADAIVYATALAYDAGLLTCDRHFEGLPRVHFVPKGRALSSPRLLDV